MQVADFTLFQRSLDDVMTFDDDALASLVRCSRCSMNMKCCIEVSARIEKQEFS